MRLVTLRPLWAVVIGMIALTSTLLILAGCRQSPEIVNPTTGMSPLGNASRPFNGEMTSAPDTPIAANSVVSTVNDHDIVGNAACASCHPSEFKIHHASRHNSTLRVIDASRPTSLDPPTGAAGDTGYQIAKAGGSLYMTTDGLPQDGQPLQYALGSGKSGITYVRLLDAGNMIELRESYFPKTHQWATTPGQEVFRDRYVGRQHSGPFVHECIMCHATKVDKQTGEPVKSFLGVGCESCHGPGRAHVAAMKSGHTIDIKDIKIERIGTWKAEKLIDMCGKCHGSVNMTRQALVGQTQRFMSSGLKLSECYLQTNKTLSCLTCHDAHANAGDDIKSYELRCLSCHTPTTTTHQAGQIDFVRKPCPVNPKTGCIDCHMPKRPAFPGVQVPTLLTDHWIRADRVSKTPKQ